VADFDDNDDPEPLQIIDFCPCALLLLHQALVCRRPDARHALRLPTSGPNKPHVAEYRFSPNKVLIDPYACGPDSPVECVNWHEASEFRRRLSDMTGCAHRLPSEAEWDYAC
jgi:hypothetical protein